MRSPGSGSAPPTSNQQLKKQDGVVSRTCRGRRIDSTSALTGYRGVFICLPDAAWLALVARMGERVLRLWPVPADLPFVRRGPVGFLLLGFFAMVGLPFWT